MRSSGVPARYPALEELIAGPGLAGLGPQPRSSRLPPDQLEAALASLFERDRIPAAAQPLVRATVLLWHDHLEASHQISQTVRSADGSFLHGIMHRREPDYGNAKYWFQRVGAHPCFPLILDRVKAAACGFPSARFLADCGTWTQWDAFAFVDACEDASSRPPGSAEVKALEKIQEIETRTLLDHILAGG
jgi:hypothetical protein